MRGPPTASNLEEQKNHSWPIHGTKEAQGVSQCPAAGREKGVTGRAGRNGPCGEARHGSSGPDGPPSRSKRLQRAAPSRGDRANFQGGNCRGRRFPQLHKDRAKGYPQNVGIGISKIRKRMRGPAILSRITFIMSTNIGKREGAARGGIRRRGVQPLRAGLSSFLRIWSMISCRTAMISCLEMACFLNSRRRRNRSVSSGTKL